MFNLNLSTPCLFSFMLLPRYLLLLYRDRGCFTSLHSVETMEILRKILGIAAAGTALLGYSMAWADCGARRDSSEPLSTLPSDLTAVGLQKLLSFDLEVVSAAKKTQRFGDVPAAIYVLSQEDIHRSGVTTVADALALVPGLQVAKIDNHRWAITARGFNSTFSHKLLVLVDGVRVFSPGFNGVWWNEQDLVLEDIDRVEVIRGPGAATWGANATNGVINIITCSAKETQGALTSVTSGKEQNLETLARYGGKIGNSTHYRMYGKYKSVDESEVKSGGEAFDAYQASTGGVRVDSQLSTDEHLTLKFDNAYQDRDLTATVPSLAPPYVDQATFSGSKASNVTTLLARYDRNTAPGASYYAQLDYTHEEQAGKVHALGQDTLHFELQQRIPLSNAHDFSHNFEYRYSADRFDGNFADRLIPSEDTSHLVNYSAQDDFSLIPDRLRLTLGSKFEHHSYTGFGYMPNGRLLFNVNDRNSVWIAVSRALADPSRIEESVQIPVFAAPEPQSGLPLVGLFLGNDKIKPEELIAYELGYRALVSDNLSLDIATFIHEYDDLTSAEPQQPSVGMLEGQTGPSVNLPLRFENALKARSYGVELAADYQPFSIWKLRAGYTYFHLNFDQGDSADSSVIAFFENSYPDSQAQVHSMIDLSSEVQLDTFLRYVDHLRFGEVPAYVELGARIGWRPTDCLELELIGQNLLHNAHAQFRDTVLPPPVTEVERQYYVRGTYRF